MGTRSTALDGKRSKSFLITGIVAMTFFLAMFWSQIIGLKTIDAKASNHSPYCGRGHTSHHAAHHHNWHHSNYSPKRLRHHRRNDSANHHKRHHHDMHHARCDDEPSPSESPSPSDSSRPGSTDAELTTSGGFANRLDAGDVLKACFDEALAALNTGDAVEFVDADGDITTLTNGGNATFKRGDGSDTQVGDDPSDELPESCPANQTLIITVTGAVADQNAAGDGIVNVPVQATDSAGVADLAGNEWNIADSDDTVFDLNAGNDAEVFE
jgi:hypothetical protein